MPQAYAAVRLAVAIMVRQNEHYPLHTKDTIIKAWSDALYYARYLDETALVCDVLNCINNVVAMRCILSPLTITMLRHQLRALVSDIGAYRTAEVLVDPRYVQSASRVDDPKLATRLLVRIGIEYLRSESHRKQEEGRELLEHARSLSQGDVVRKYTHELDLLRAAMSQGNLVNYDRVRAIADRMLEIYENRGHDGAIQPHWVADWMFHAAVAAEMALDKRRTNRYLSLAESLFTRTKTKITLRYPRFWELTAVGTVREIVEQRRLMHVAAAISRGPSSEVVSLVERIEKVLCDS